MAYTISKSQIEQAIVFAEKDGFPNQPLVDLLQSLLQQGEAQPAPAAHMYPWDLERFATNETMAHAYSVAVGCPDGKSVPLFTHPPAPKLVTAEDVTDEMHQKWNKIFNDPDYIPRDGEIIAAAVNAFNGLTLEASK